MKKANWKAQVRHFIFFSIFITSIIICTLYQLKIEVLAFTKDEDYKESSFNEITGNGVSENVIVNNTVNSVADSNENNVLNNKNDKENNVNNNNDITETSILTENNNESNQVILDEKIDNETTSNSIKKQAQYNQITVIYNIDISEQATGLGEDFLYDGISVPTIHNSNTYTVKIDNPDSITLESISSKFVTPYDNNTTYNTKDRSVLEFKGWKVKKNSNVIKEGTVLKWNQLLSYAEDGVVNLSTSWECKENYQYVNFYLNYCSVALDINGNITHQDPNEFTPSLWASAIGNPSTEFGNIADETADNSYTANKKIRALEGEKSDKSLFIYQIPSDEYIFEQLKQYASNISIDGESIPVDKLNSDHFEVRWYVFKLQQDCWHIDGKLVRREGKMVINKEFRGSKSVIELVTGYSFNSGTFLDTDYYIELKTANSNSELFLKDAEMKKNIDSKLNEKGETEEEYILNFTWIVDVKYGIKYSISEKNYLIQNHNTETTHKIIDPNENKFKKVFKPDGSYELAKDDKGNNIILYENQSKDTTIGDYVNVIGINNYTLDHQEVSDLINVNFVNTYTLKSEDEFKMPETGGTGIKVFCSIGIGIMATQAIMYIIGRFDKRININ